METRTNEQNGWTDRREGQNSYLDILSHCLNKLGLVRHSERYWEVGVLRWFEDGSSVSAYVDVVCKERQRILTMVYGKHLKLACKKKTRTH